VIRSTVPSVSARRLSWRIQARSKSTDGTVSRQTCSVKLIARKMFTVVDQSKQLALDRAIQSWLNSNAMVFVLFRGRYR
jgi:hypothetical protein